MGQSQNLPATVFSKLAGADLSAAQYRLVKMASTAGEVIAAAAGTDDIVGVLQNDPADAEVASIGVGGILKLQVQASISVGDWLTSDSTGRGAATTTDGDVVIGHALEASTAAGDIIQVVSALSRLYVA
jgi:hypothetical protein